MALTITRLISPTDWSNKQINGIKAVGQQNYLAGIQRPKKDPIAAGIAAEDKWANMVNQAIQNKTRAKKLANVTAQEWESYAETIGANRLVDGVVRRQAKVTAFTTAFQPQLQNLLGTIDAMPTATQSDRNQKMIATIDGLRALRGQW